MTAALTFVLIALAAIYGALLVVNHILGTGSSNEEAGHA